MKQDNPMTMPPPLPGLMRKTPVPEISTLARKVIAGLRKELRGLKTDEKVEVVTLAVKETKFASLRKRKTIVAVLHGYRPESSSLGMEEKQLLKFVPKKGYKTCGDWLLHSNSVDEAVLILTKHYNDLHTRAAQMEAAIKN